MMSTTTGIRLGELVDRFGGQLLGSPELLVTRFAPLSEAGEGELSFLSNPKLRAQAQLSRASALILSEKDHVQIDESFSGARILVANPYAYFARVATLFASLQTVVPSSGIHPLANVHSDAKVAHSASIAAFVSIAAGAVIGENVIIESGCNVGRGARIGDDSHLHANISVYDNCQVGQRAIIHAGAVIGADGFGFANDAGQWVKIPQTGRVLIGDDVEIGANTSIDRGAMADTVIEDGVKLDNQIQIGHNCHIGAHTLMSGCVGVAGSATIGKHCVFGGAAMILGHLSIADHVQISSGSLVTRSISEPGLYTGFYPIAKNADWEKTASIVRNLSTMRDKIRQMEKQIKLLTGSEIDNENA